MEHVVLALLIDPRGRVLLGRRAPHKRAYPGCWDVLGGHVEDGETLAQALVREVQEESGLTPVRFHFHATFREPRPAINGHNAYHIFIVRAWQGGNAPTPSHEHTELRWILIAEARSLADLAMPQYRDVFDGVEAGALESSAEPPTVPSDP